MIDNLGYSLEKNRFTNTKSFYNTFQAQNNSYPRNTVNNNMGEMSSGSPSPNNHNKRVASNLTSPNIDTITSHNSRPHSTEKTPINYSKNFMNRGINFNNTTSFTPAPSSIIHRDTHIHS